MEHKKPGKTVENRIQNKQDKNVERENAEKETTAEKNYQKWNGTKAENSRKQATILWTLYKGAWWSYKKLS